jgi:sorbitol-6-phosphate 2-dehydrogenase
MSDWLNLNGKVIIVTGGASGIGYAVAEQLVNSGAKVQLIDIHPPKGWLGESANVNFYNADISRSDSVNLTVNQIIDKHSRIDGLVNNAGINIPRLLIDTKADVSRYELKDEEFDKMVNVNQKGVYLMSQAVARNMAKHCSGVIINMCSESGLEGSEGQSCYAATKAALYSFTRSWAKELGKFGIRVVGVAPGILEKTGLRTEEYETALAYTRNITIEQLRSGYTKNSIPIGREGKLSEVADFVAYLLSERASYITGITSNVSGGKTRG